MPALITAPYNRPADVALAFGTRPEVIKPTPVIAALADSPVFRPLVVSSGQHTDLLSPFVAHLGVRVDHALNLMLSAESLNRLLARMLTGPDVIGLLSESWVIASDSGGVQEEASSLDVPLLLLWENTERPEVLDTRLTKLYATGDDLGLMLHGLHRTDTTSRPTDNPFGDGHAAERIVAAQSVAFGVTSAEVAA